MLDYAALDGEDLGFFASIVPLESLVNDLDSCLVKYLSSAPLHGVSPAVLVDHLRLDSPEGLWYELLDLLGLIHAEAKGRSLARTIGQHSKTSRADCRSESSGLEPREGHTNLEIKDLARINR